MRVNLADAIPTHGNYPPPRLQSLIDDSARAVGFDGTTPLTGRTALMSTDISGVYQVWFETENDTWVHINEDGEPVESDCPLNMGVHIQ